jgi:hypothetical protein
MEKYNLEKFKEFLNGGTMKANITTAVLVAVSVASLPYLILPAMAIGLIDRFFRGSRYGRRYNKKQFSNAFTNLKRQKLIEYIADKNGKTIVKITKKGESKLRAFAIDLIKIKKLKIWDGKWRVTIFDIPVRFKKAREALRMKLKDLGFVQLQKSVWLHPYPCEDEIIFIADFFGVGKCVEILTTDSFLNESRFKRHFGFTS